MDGVYDISNDTDVGTARRAIRVLTSRIGFSEVETEEIALVVTELGKNLVKHAQDGVMVARSLERSPGDGIEIVTMDQGPGIAQAEQMIIDGNTSKDSLGYGLGTVDRLMDELTLGPRTDHQQGSMIRCRRRLKDLQGTNLNINLDAGAAARCHPGSRLNGDAWIIKKWQNNLLVGVIDGLGHGPHAHKAAQTARQVMSRHYDCPLPDLFKRVERACRKTRGVVMALAKIQADKGTEELTGGMQFASIGNISSRLWKRAGGMNFHVTRGIVGANAPAPKVSIHDVSPSDVLVLHSDGVSTHWRWEMIRPHFNKTATDLAAWMLRRLGKNSDDAVVLVVKAEKTEDR